MKFKIVQRLYDNRKGGSVTAGFRQRRLDLFKRLIADMERPVKVLDVGGTEDFWDTVAYRADLEIVILNIEAGTAQTPRYRRIIGDARDLSMFGAKTFDVVFSNAVIEHVGDHGQQRRMALEVRRVGKRVFLQAPHRYFPIEPHFLYPFFQFMPVSVRVWLLVHASLTWRYGSKREIESYVRQVRLLTKSELAGLFPGALIVEERVAGLTKSFIVCDGWARETVRLARGALAAPRT